MNGFLDGFSVGLLLLAGFGYAIYALAPKSLRARLSTGAAVLVGRLPVPGARSLAGRLAASGRTGAACGGCATCGSNAAQDPPRAAADGRSGMRDEVVGVTEVRVPLSKIRRRR